MPSRREEGNRAFDFGAEGMDEGGVRRAGVRRWVELCAAGGVNDDKLAVPIVGDGEAGASLALILASVRRPNRLEGM